VFNVSWHEIEPEFIDRTVFQEEYYVINILASSLNILMISVIFFTTFLSECCQKNPYKINIAKSIQMLDWNLGIWIGHIIEC